LGSHAATAIVRIVRWQSQALLLAAVLLAAWLVCGAPRARAGRVACSTVISTADQLSRGKAADASELAKKLSTTAAWVEHCMETYGRRTRRSGLESQEGREQRLEAFEDDEPEEAAPEDKEEEGESERPERPERERQVKIRPTPTFSLRSLDAQ